ncbi:DctP family TRAP transporter solute-binding subunit [Thauera butanivorans]|uniref:DctP family TRAP transporter solute-binding subunit n=1 Tax=Thauera butanivorans TaxID=86174 RepID=UPI00083828D6|nr:DctP family TRAP transporter solute-binding subunit [Thauera butanivorans]
MNTKLGSALLAASLACGALLAGSAAAAEITAKFAVTLQESSHQGQGVAKFVELVKERSQGRINIRPYYNAALGNDVQVTSALQGGSIQFVVPQTTTLTGMIKDFEVLDYPFLFDSEKEVEAVLDGPVGQRLLDSLPEKGLVGLAFWENGFFNFTNSRRPIAKLEDFNGLKLRAIQARISQESIKVLGATPVPLAVPELYTALETRTVDGQGTTAAVTAALRLDEVQKYLSLTRHTYGAFIPLASKKFWDKLSEDDRKLLMQAAADARSYQRNVAREQELSAIAQMTAKGLAVNEISAAERTRMREASMPLWSAFSQEAGQEIFEAAQAEIAKVRD